MVQQQQCTTQRHSAAWATHRSESKNKTAVHTVTHRVVSPGYGRLPSGVWIHGVNDRLSLPFLVDLAKAPTGLSVRGLSLKVLLIFIHIVHLEVIRSEVVREKGGVTVFIFTHTLSQSPHPAKENTHTKNPTLLHYSSHSTTSLSWSKNRSVCRLHNTHLRQRVLTRQKKR